MRNQNRTDLIILASDKDVEFALSGLFSRSESLGIRHVGLDIFVHPYHDSGCYKKSGEFLKPYQNHYDHALVVFDREGCGYEDCNREKIEETVEKDLSVSGWNDRARVIVIDPEVEMWIWSDSPHVENALGWNGQNPSLKHWLVSQHYLSEGQIKPTRPKESLEAALRKVRKPRSPSIYKQIAEKVSLNKCVDSSFIKLKETLQSWFPVNDACS